MTTEQYRNHVRLLTSTFIDGIMQQLETFIQKIDPARLALDKPELTGVIMKVRIVDVESVVNELLPEFPKGLKTRNRRTKLMIHRQVTWYLLREMGHNYVQLANYFGYDHSNVLFACRKVKMLLETKDAKLTPVYYKIINLLQKNFNCYDGNFPALSQLQPDSQSIFPDDQHDGGSISTNDKYPHRTEESQK